MLSGWQKEQIRTLPWEVGNMISFENVAVIFVFEQAQKGPYFIIELD
jgi:hypothetical protein